MSPAAAIIKAVMRNDYHKTKSLLEKGVDPNSCEDDACITPLHFAAMYNATAVIPLLITAGAKFDNVTEEGETPLEIAKLNKNPSAAILIEQLQRFNHHEQRKH